MDSATSGRVLVVGDLNPDLILRGDVVPRFGQAEQLLDDATLVLGGSAAIAAHGLGRLGRPVSLLAGVGDDLLGEHVRRKLAEANVGLERLVVSPDRPTGLSVILSRGDDRSILTHPGAVPTLSGDDVLQAARSMRDDGLRHVHIGALYLQPDLAEGLEATLAQLKSDGLTTSLDTNDDPSSRWEGVDVLLPHLDLLLPNRAEVVGLGRDADPRAAAATLAAAGPMVVVKDGPDGAFAVTSGATTTTTAPVRRVVDSTGAGDTFDAAFIDAWLDASPLDIALRRAAVAGSLAVGAVGGTAGQPTRDELAAAVASAFERLENDHDDR